jgi:hypothetical protein
VGLVGDGRYRHPRGALESGIAQMTTAAVIIGSIPFVLLILLVVDAFLQDNKTND